MWRQIVNAVKRGLEAIKHDEKSACSRTHPLQSGCWNRRIDEEQPWPKRAYDQTFERMERLLLADDLPCLFGHGWADLCKETATLFRVTLLAGRVLQF